MRTGSVIRMQNRVSLSGVTVGRPPKIIIAPPKLPEVEFIKSDFAHEEIIPTEINQNVETVSQTPTLRPMTKKIDP